MRWEVSVAVAVGLAALIGGCGRAPRTAMEPPAGPPPGKAAEESPAEPPAVVGTFVERLDAEDAKAVRDLGVSAPTLTISADGTWRRDDLGVASSGDWSHDEAQDAYVLRVAQEDGQPAVDRKRLLVRAAGDDVIRLTDLADGSESSLERKGE